MTTGKRCAMVNFPKKLSKLRQSMGLTQGALAERLGITKGMVSSYERSLAMPSYEVLIVIARIFGVSTDYLLGLDSRENIDISHLSEAQKQSIYQLLTVFDEKK